MVIRHLLCYFSSTLSKDFLTLNKEETILSCVEIEPAHPATHSIIWLHGLGADGNDFVSFAPELKLPKSANMRFIFPNAPIMPITINNGYEMRAWYDIYAIALDAKIDSAGITESVGHIEKLIAREIKRGVASNNIFLGGFSQGAAIALTTGLCYSKTLGGIIGLSGYLPLAQELPEMINPANQKTPVFLAHGTLDPVVPFGLGLYAHTFLKHAGYTVDWNSYPMAHSVCNEEIKDISEWMRKLIE